MSGGGNVLFGGQEAVAQWLAEYGHAALLLLFVLEGAMLMYFVPSESLVPLAVASPLASGLWEYVLVVVVAVVGATIGQTGLFLVAQRGGREYLLERRWFRVKEKHIDRFEEWFDCWGPVAVPVSNTLLFTRGMLTVPAGFSDLDWRLFAVLSATGTLVFETALALTTLGVIDAVL